MSPADPSAHEPIFQLKGSTLTITLLELARYDLERFAGQLADRVAKAPNFFSNMPLILALDKLPIGEGTVELGKLIALCHDFGLCTLAIRSNRPHDIAAAAALHLPVLPPSQTSERSLAPPLRQKTETEPGRPSKIVSKPIRGGQQIYAQDCDLIVIGPVSAGAELLSDGNIHVYGPLRGRALAGIKGDSKARVFCRQLNAEMISIAGRYKVAEDLRRDPLWGQSVQVGLAGDLLNINRL
jgi:septum site-determining protein MinC